MNEANFNKRREYLASIEVERQVKDVEAARDPELIEWCVQRLAQGMNWDELRRRLGLGPAAIDSRWKEIRKHILSQARPENPQEALLSALTEEAAAMEKLDDHMEDLEKVLSEAPLTKEERANRHNFYKYRFDAIKQKLESAHKKFDMFMDTKKLAHQGKTGITILIQNNIPRPSKLVEAIKVEQIETASSDEAPEIGVECLKSS